MRLLTKEFYTLAELQSVWGMADYDVQYLVLTGDLKLTIMVHLQIRDAKWRQGPIGGC